jgi:hypothetical protein
MTNIQDLGNGEFQREFLFDNQLHTARISMTTDPAVATIFDANGHEVAVLNVPGDVHVDMKHSGVGDADTLLAVIIETYISGKEMADLPEGEE